LWEGYALSLPVSLERLGVYKELAMINIITAWQNIAECEQEDYNAPQKLDR